MPRTISLTIAVDRRADLLAELSELSLLSLRLHREASVKPPGDVIEVEVANETLRDVMRVADHYGLGRPGGLSMSTSEPLSVISTTDQAHTRERGAMTWEELELSMGSDSTMTSEKVLVMGIAGVIAGIGIVSDALHIVVGAMVIAPGFQPFARFVLGLVNGNPPSWKGGLLDIGRAYAALVAGSAIAAVLAWLLGASPLDADVSGYLATGTLVDYWTTLTWTGVVVGAVAGVCGGLLMSINRTVLTAGVMVALALVPTASLVPMAMLAGNFTMAGSALLRFLVEVALVLLGSALVFGVKRYLDRRSLT
ncbi:MAG TPA: DUF389 domain-containing protein [Egibacteraceae bacterium]|nr:DUF389 domain-containing protein [Egibacteraceae bacterium]